MRRPWRSHSLVVPSIHPSHLELQSLPQMLATGAAWFVGIGSTGIPFHFGVTALVDGSFYNAIFAVLCSQRSCLKQHTQVSNTSSGKLIIFVRAKQHVNAQGPQS